MDHKRAPGGMIPKIKIKVHIKVLEMGARDLGGTGERIGEQIGERAKGHGEVLEKARNTQGGAILEKAKGKKGRLTAEKVEKEKTPMWCVMDAGERVILQKNCPSRVNSFVEDTPDAHEENGDEEGCWCFVEAESEDISACEAHESIEDCRCDFTEVLSKKGKKEIKREKVDVMMIQETRGKWVRIEAGVDSCAAVNVCPTHMFPQVPVVETMASLSGKCYSAANGGTIKNEGEKTVEFQTHCGKDKKVKFQCAKVTKVLLSVEQLSRAGLHVDLDPRSPNMTSLKNGKRFR